MPSQAQPMRVIPPLLPRAFEGLASSQRPPALSILIVEPEVFEALTVVDAVDHQGQPLQRGRSADRSARKEDHRPSVVLDQFSLDLPDQLLALPKISLDRLLIDQLIDVRVAVGRVITGRAAGIVFVI